MERKARFYDFLIGGTNSKAIRYRDLALKGRHALHKKERKRGDFPLADLGGSLGRLIYIRERGRKRRGDSLIVRGGNVHKSRKRESGNTH